MKKEQSIETLEALLAGACVLLNDAAAIQKAIAIPPEKEVLKAISEALMRCWDARDIIQKERPDLKPEFMTHAEEYPEIEDAYGEAIEEAVKFEQAGSFGNAIEVYQGFLESAPEGYFRRIVEFRIANLKAVP